MIQILIVLILIDQTKTFKTYFAASWLLELAWELGNLHNSMKTSRLWLAAASRWRGLSCDWLAHLSIIPPLQEYDWMRSLAGIAALARLWYSLSCISHKNYPDQIVCCLYNGWCVTNYWTSANIEVTKVYYSRVFITSRGAVQCNDDSIGQKYFAQTSSMRIWEKQEELQLDPAMLVIICQARQMTWVTIWMWSLQSTAWRARDKNSILAIFIQLRSAAGCKTIKLHLPGTKQRGRRDVRFIVISRPKVGAG